MLSVGAWLIGSRDSDFYTELKPLNDNAVPEAMKVTGFDLAKLAESGDSPEIAMSKFSEWVRKVCGEGRPVFVGFNAGFDWSFVNWYFIHFLKDNPFGFAPLDIKSYYMGITGCNWESTKSSRIPTEFQSTTANDHNALNDARAQGEMFAKMRARTKD